MSAITELEHGYAMLRGRHALGGRLDARAAAAGGCPFRTPVRE
jgi:hypothetical protein